MMKRPLTRRRFLEGCALTGAAAVCTSAAASPAFAEGGQIGVSARPVSQQVNTVCQACPNGCSFTAYVVDGKLGKVIGDGADPQAAGRLCTRGYGCTQEAAEARVKNPQRRKEDGSFQTISWDEALAGIAERTLAIVDGAGPGAVALIHDGISTTAAAYGPRFMAALGSANAFVDDVTLNVNKGSAYMQVIGVDSYDADLPHADLILLLDTSYADIATPGLAAQLQAARAAGTPIIAVDARLGTLASFADEWIGVNPGTELALLLAVCNQLIRTNRYDRAFVEANVSGFSGWAASISECTPAWAEGITGVDGFRIEELAARIFEAAPRVAVEYGNGRVGAGTFSNSSETARCVCLLNALCGAWGVEGGALLPFDLSAASFEAAVGAPWSASSLKAAGFGPTFPLGRPQGASAANALRQARTGAIRALFCVDADIAYDYASIQDLDEVLEGLDLFVCLSREMTETALLADYLLPVAPSMESAQLPRFCGGGVATASMAHAVTETDDGTALPLDVAIQALAAACGAGDAFDFTLEEAAAAQLEAVGLSLEGLASDGSAQVGAPRVASWRTPTGKIQCASAACADAGMPASPVWVPTLEQSSIQAVIENDMDLGQADITEVLAAGGFGALPTFHLVTGQQTVLGAAGYDAPELTDIAEAYGLDGVWINAQVASALGISSGDEVWVGNDRAVAKARAFVTQRIVPTAVYLPFGFGRTSPKLSNASGVGVNPLRFSEAVIEGGYGTLCTQEACVWLRKEGE